MGEAKGPERGDAAAGTDYDRSGTAGGRPEARISAIVSGYGQYGAEKTFAVKLGNAAPRPRVVF